MPQLPGYEVLGELGRGGMGVVYRAHDRKLNRPVAIKMVLGGAVAGPSALVRFLAEAEALATLDHPNVVHVYGRGEYQGLPFFVMEFCPGGSLEARVRERPLPPREAAELVERLARGVAAAHARNILHRDLKPENVLFAADGTPKLTDFGLAKRFDDSGGEADGLTATGAVMGTPNYMAPEQARGDTKRVGPAADVYALGAILYRLVTGRPPFVGVSGADTVRQVLTDEPVAPTRLVPALPRDLSTICLKCLHKDPARRYASAIELADEVRRLLDGRPILARPAGPVERAVKWARRSPLRAAAVAALPVVVAVSFAALYANLRLARHDLADRERRDEVRVRFGELYGDATRRAAAAPADDLTAWEGVAGATQAALAAAGADTALLSSPLGRAAGDLHDYARARAAAARASADRRARMASLRERHADAGFFASMAAGQELPDGPDRACAAADEGLRLFGVTVDGRGPPAGLDSYSPADADLAAAFCYDLLLTRAAALARPTRAGTPADRLRAVLACLDRAAAVRPGRSTHFELTLRADCLDRLGGAAEGRRLRERAAGLPCVTAADHFMVALRHYEAGQSSAALKCLAAGLRADPGHYGSRYLLGLCHLRERNWAEGRAAFTLCLDARPAFSWPRLVRAIGAMEEGDVDDARADLDAVLANPPDERAACIALVNRGVLAMRQGEWGPAVADLAEARGRDRMVLAADVNLAAALRHRAEGPEVHLVAALIAPRGGVGLLVAAAACRVGWREAEAVLGAALDRNPHVPRLYHERGRLRVLLADRAGARADFGRAVELAGSDGWTSTLAEDLAELGHLAHSAGGYGEAVQYYDRALAAAPDRPDVVRLKAESLLADKRYAEAAAALDRYLTLSGAAAPVDGREAGRRAAALQTRGVLYERVGDRRAAIDCYGQSLRADRTVAALTLRGWAYLTQGADRLAEQDFDEALRTSPADGEALLGRGEALARLGRPAEAEADVAGALRHGPRSARAVYVAARVEAQAAAGYTRAGAGPQAAAARSRAVELIGEAVRATPAGEREAFWKHVVQLDPGLAALRETDAFVALAVEMYRVRPGGIDR